MRSGDFVKIFQMLKHMILRVLVSVKLGVCDEAGYTCRPDNTVTTTTTDCTFSEFTCYGCEYVNRMTDLMRRPSVLQACQTPEDNSWSRSNAYILQTSSQTPVRSATQTTHTYTHIHTHTHEAHHHTASLTGQRLTECQYCTVESIATFIAILFDPYYCNTLFQHFFLDTFSPIANFYHDLLD